MHCPEYAMLKNIMLQKIRSADFGRIYWTWTEHSIKKKQPKKKNHGENNNTEKCMVPKKIQYRKQMESMMQLFYYPSRSLHSAHSTFYILPYVQLTNWDDKNSVCFTAYIFNLHSEILQQKSAGSCDKNNLYVLRDASFFKPYL